MASSNQGDGSGASLTYYNSSRLRAGCHLVYNTFWAIQGFFIYQMCMWDPMHQVDNAVIVQHVKSIVRLFSEQVESVLGKAGLASKNMTARLTAAGLQNG